MMEPKLICVGPWGSKHGKTKWSFNEDGNKIIKTIVIVHGGAIDSIVFKGTDEKYSEKFGGNEGFRTTKIDLDAPQEYLTSISGHYGYFMPEGPLVIRSLQFVSNVTKYGPIGPADGTPFSLPMEGGTIVGFHGIAGQFLEAIGVFIKPTSTVFQCLNSVATVKVTPLPNAVMKEFTQQATVGPWGGLGGKPFDDGTFTGIKQIFVQRGETVVNSILIEYDRNGQSVWSHRHGGTGGEITNRIKLNYPEEYLISLNGFYGAYEGHEVIKSISFHTTKGRYGPFGEEGGIFFSSGEVQAKVVGFHGRCALYLDAIGVLREYF